MTTEVKYATCAERVTDEVKRLQTILDRRGQFYEDEQALFAAYSNVLAWQKEDKEESDRIELAAMEAEEAAEEERRRNDPNFKTKEIFSSYRDKLKKEGRMR